MYSTKTVVKATKDYDGRTKRARKYANLDVGYRT